MLSSAKEKLHATLKKHGDRIGLDLPYFVKNGFWVAVRQGIAIVSGIFVTVVFARFASQEVLGQYQFVLSVLAVLSIVSIPGLNTSIIRSAARGYDGDYKRAVWASFFWSLLGIPALLAIGGYYYSTGDSSLGIALMISAIFFPFIYAPNTWDSFIQGKGRFDVAAKYNSVQAIVNTLTTIAVVFFSRENLVVIVGWYLFSYTFFNGYYYWRSLRYVENEKTDEDTMKYGWFLTKINILGLVADNIDKLLIGILLSPGALAAYYVLSVIPLKIKDAIKPFFGILYPKLSNAEGSLWEIVSAKKTIALVSLFILVILSVAYVNLIAPLSLSLFGDSYAGYYGYSRYYAVLLFVLPALLSVIKYAQIRKYDDVIAISDSGYALLRIVLSIILICYFGLIGAIISYNIAIFVWLLLYLVAIRKKEKQQG